VIAPSRESGKPELSTSPLIPAKAGIQACKGKAYGSWIPAFAGMSGGVAPVHLSLWERPDSRSEPGEGASPQ
jgi:hypothetical protein